MGELKRSIIVMGELKRSKIKMRSANDHLTGLSTGRDVASASAFKTKSSILSNVYSRPRSQLRFLSSHRLSPFSLVQFLVEVLAMASLVACQAVATVSKVAISSPTSTSKSQMFAPLRLKECAGSRGPKVVCAVGDVSAAGTNYLIAGAVAIALVGTAFPILFSRKDLCPECDGAGFVRKTGSALNANAARKDQEQIVCRNCNGLGKVGQVDKANSPVAKSKRR